MNKSELISAILELPGLTTATLGQVLIYKVRGKPA